MLFGNLSVFICDIRQFQIHRYLMQWERMPFQFHIAMPWSSYGIEKLNFTLFLLSFECILRKTSWTPFASYLCYLPVNLIFESGTKSNRRASSSFKSHNQKQCANVYVYATSSVHDVQKMKCTEWGEWNADVANAQSAGGGTLNACWKKRIHGKFNLTDEIQVYLVGFVAMYTTSVLRFCLQNTPPAVSIFAVVLRFFLLCKNGVSFWTCYRNTCTIFICYHYYNFLRVRCLAFYFADIFVHHNSLFKPTLCSMWFNCRVVFDSRHLWCAKKW